MQYKPYSSESRISRIWELTDHDEVLEIVRNVRMSATKYHRAKPYLEARIKDIGLHSKIGSVNSILGGSQHRECVVEHKMSKRVWNFEDYSKSTSAPAPILCTVRTVNRRAKGSNIGYTKKTLNRLIEGLWLFRIIRYNARPRIWICRWRRTPSTEATKLKPERHS